MLTTLIPVLLIIVVASVLIHTLIRMFNGRLQLPPIFPNNKKAKALLLIAFSILIIAAPFVYIFYDSNRMDHDLAEDIESGAIKLYRVDAIADTHEVDIPGGITSVIYKNLKIRPVDDTFGLTTYQIETTQFEDISQITKPSVGFIRMHEALGTSATYEANLRRERRDYKKTETPHGTAFTYEELTSSGKTDSYLDNDPETGRFIYTLFIKNSDYQLLISTTYQGQKDLSVRWSPLIDREYALKLSELIINNLQIPDTLELGIVN
jgi:hypothetical protein